mmetsp:Transcript_7551/g.8708  ORF Transcript_7551/g.8708 Transcript_7551/m.8708 type:complete len:249 (+) Transcript_7551:111-857(+)|eukprot:CAMPEP_0204643204 /NCGR_PEP_ID=MMETSP0718-20130828/523_1 /ASSEMBLY_ACC=CAM_ASM_000674 /TAXON_ID=230516 /ORGANISM="Chaetoceros curvisetus" /LENGTH=248 /DNA_ID=CAMNT_0051664321 /DNA_START=36 /DNA_END=782 /DNA_ORIENTATION=-
MTTSKGQMNGERLRIQRESEFLHLIEGVQTRYDLPALWGKMYDLKENQDINPIVVTFYGNDFEKQGPKASFSNFYIHEATPFTIPDSCWRPLQEKLANEGLENMPPRTVDVSFSEKSIMLCKAAVMGDVVAYHQIFNAEYPSMCKGLGRKVAPFDEKVWQKVLLEVAYEVVYQKFRAFRDLEESKILHDFLIQTGNALIAEAAPRDRIWGIGKGATNPKCADCRSWGKGNVLGFALMKARDKLLNEIE